jgi:hypothetical protein
MLDIAAGLKASTRLPIIQWVYCYSNKQLWVDKWMTETIRLMYLLRKIAFHFTPLFHANSQYPF